MRCSHSPCRRFPSCCFVPWHPVAVIGYRKLIFSERLTSLRNIFQLLRKFEFEIGLPSRLPSIRRLSARRRSNTRLAFVTRTPFRCGPDFAQILDAVILRRIFIVITTGIREHPMRREPRVFWPFLHTFCMYRTHQTHPASVGNTGFHTNWAQLIVRRTDC